MSPAAAKSTSARLNGEPVTAEQLRPLAVINYGHFTAMQVRGRAVQGLDLHIARLQAGTRELFEAELPRERIVDALADAVRHGPPDSSLRLTVFSRAFDYRAPLQPVPLDILVTLGPAAHADKPSLRVKSFEFVRTLPQVKHVGTFPLFHLRRRALQDGFDDALFVTPDGRISEGSIWNVGFWDGEGVVWPTGPALRGTSEQLLQAGLAELGIAQSSRPVSLAEAADFRAAFAANASGVQTIHGIDAVAYPEEPELPGLLRRALARPAWTPIA